MANNELLEKTMKFIEDHPEQHTQHSYWTRVDGKNYCGTAYCFAGHAAILSGAEPPTKLDDASWWYVDLSDLSCKPSGARDVIDIVVYASKVLGLTSDQYYELFDGSNSVEDLREMVEEIKRNPDVSGEQLSIIRDGGSIEW